MNGNISKCGCIRCSPSKICTISTASSRICLNIHREDSVIFLINSYLDLNFDVLHADTNLRCVDHNDIRLVSLGPIGLFSIFRLTTSSGNDIEDIIHAHFVS